MKKIIQFYILLLINLCINIYPLSESKIADSPELNHTKILFLEEITKNKLLTQQRILALEESIQINLQQQQEESIQNKNCLALLRFFIDLENEEETIPLFIKNHAACIDYFMAINMENASYQKQREKETNETPLKKILLSIPLPEPTSIPLPEQKKK